MPSKYVDEFEVRAVRLVIDHGEEYDTRTTCITAVAKRLGVSYESLRRWVTSPRWTPGSGTRCPPTPRAGLRELKRKNRELEETIEILKAATSFFVRESEPRYR
ncbi:transposase [Mycolicibacterium sp. XJ662]